MHLLQRGEQPIDGGAFQPCLPAQLHHTQPLRRCGQDGVHDLKTAQQGLAGIECNGFVRGGFVRCADVCVHGFCGVGLRIVDKRCSCVASRKKKSRRTTYQRRHHDTKIQASFAVLRICCTGSPAGHGPRVGGQQLSQQTHQVRGGLCRWWLHRRGGPAGGQPHGNGTGPVGAGGKPLGRQQQSGRGSGGTRAGRRLHGLPVHHCQHH
ncbi:hypothetical protein D3C71_1423070 [compost metagenome]